MKYSFLIIITTLAFVPVYAQAQTSLNFHKADKYKELKAVSLIKNTAETNHQYLIAKTDLNGDFIDEYVVKPAKCNVQNLCPFTVVAYMNKEPVEIGRFDAHKILISETKNYGVRRLKIYNKPSNDFTSQNAVWAPYEFKYVYK